MIPSRAFVWSYLFAGVLILAAVASIGLPVLGITWDRIAEGLTVIGNLGLLAQITVAFVLISVAYPVGYMTNLLSYFILNRWWRGAYLKEVDAGIPREIREELGAIYGQVSSMPSGLKWGPPDFYLALMRLTVQASNDLVYRRAHELWGTAAQFSRVFSVAFFIVAGLLGGRAAWLQWADGGLFSRGVWFAAALSAGMAALCALMYNKVLKKETQSFVARYLTLRAMGQVPPIRTMGDQDGESKNTVDEGSDGASTPGSDN